MVKKEEYIMVQASEVISYFENLANIGSGVDNDGAYGYQCADVTCYIANHYFGKPLWGNAINLLDSAKAQGFEVVYVSDGAVARAGDAFVKHFVAGNGVDYGHTGLVIKDSDGTTLKTIEQNIDGNADYLEVGGPSRYNERSYNGIVGFIRFPYAEFTPGWVKNDNGWKYQNDDGHYTASAWQNIDNVWYRFNDEGFMLQNKWYQDDDGRWFWLKENGYMAIGWCKVGQSWYYFDNNGAMATGWVQWFDKWYYLQPSNGVMVSKEVRNINGEWYYFNEGGDMLEKAAVYIGPDGVMRFQQ